MSNTLQLVSVDSSGQEAQTFDASDGSLIPSVNDDASISGDGNFVEFYSNSGTLVPGLNYQDPFDAGDIYVKDLTTGAVTLASSTAGGTAIGAQDTGIISENGGTVVFTSTAVPLGGSSDDEVYAKDLATGALTLVSQTAAGVAANRDVFQPSVSADGDRVAFTTAATNLSSLSTKGIGQAYVKDQASGALTLVSTDAAGAAANAGCSIARISADGTTVAFISTATNLLPGVTSGTAQVYVKNLVTGALTLASADADGVPAGGGMASSGTTVGASFVSTSADGNLVSFVSPAANLSGTTDGYLHLYVKNISTGALTEIDTGRASSVYGGTLSEDGRFITWDGNGETDDQGHNLSYAYMTNIATGATVRLSEVDGTSFRGDDTTSFGETMSDDDRTAVFSTQASNPDIQSPTIFPGTTADVDVVAWRATTAAAPTVAFDATTAGFTDGETPILTGTVYDPNGTASVELYSGDPASGGTDLGAAAVNGDGTWTFHADLGVGNYTSLTAVASDAEGGSATATAPFTIATGVAGQLYRAIEYDNPADGSHSYWEYGRSGDTIVSATDNGDGTHRIDAFGNGRALFSLSNDVMTGGGIHEHFMFGATFGHEEVTDFNQAGQDTINLAATGFTSLVEVLQHTTMAGGSATIHVDPQNSITLDGITKADLRSHPREFVLA